MSDTFDRIGRYGDALINQGWEYRRCGLFSSRWEFRDPRSGRHIIIDRDTGQIFEERASTPGNFKDRL